MNDGEERPTDIDPRRLHRALLIYVVIALIAVTGWQVWRYWHEQSERESARVNDARVTADFADVASAVARYESDRGGPPTSFRDLLQTVNGGREPYLDRLPRDPWIERPYRFVANREHFVAFTYGRDGVEGGQGYDRDRYSAKLAGR